MTMETPISNPVLTLKVINNMDLNELHTFEEQKLVKGVQQGNRISWCYTDKVQYDRLWTPTLEMCRGLITDLEGCIIARPFKKFFNAEERPDDFKIHVNQAYDITEKIDGSLIITTKDGDGILVASKNSFTSEQADFAKKFIEANPRLKRKILENAGVTFIFEAIYPENRIILDYGDKADLTLLGLIETHTGEEFSRKRVERMADECGVQPVPIKPFKNVEEALSHTQGQSISDGEGIVIRFSSGTRFKVKSVEYIKLHRLYSTVSEKHVLELLEAGQDLSLIYSVLPDEMYQEVRDYQELLNGEYTNVTNEARAAYELVRNLPSRKEQAIALVSDPKKKEISGVVFAMLDGKDITKIKWGVVRRRRGSTRLNDTIEER